MMVRTFVSIPIKDTAPLEGVAADIGSVPGIRVPPMKQVHMTLKFIGDVDERRIPRITEAVGRACSGTAPFDIELKGIGCFPNRRRPSVVWVGAGPADRLGALADGIGRELAGIGVDFDDKPFKSHITLGRCRDGADIGPVLDRYADTSFCTFRCDRVMVMESVLSPKGARHTAVGTVELV